MELITTLLIIALVGNLLLFAFNVTERQKLDQREAKIAERENNLGNLAGVNLARYKENIRKEMENEFLVKKVEFLESFKRILKEKGWKQSA